jgi:hypothetical protein
VREEDALLVIVAWLRQGAPRGPLGPSHYGYDVYLPTLISWHLREQRGVRDSNEEHRLAQQLFPVFANAAWEMCRRGILRPGIREQGAQATADGSAGSGFSVTAFGRTWLAEDQADTFVPTEPGRFAELLAPFSDRFGLGFQERAQEAVRCYGAHAYLACCAMCGAAAESVLLATAVAKTGDEPTVLRAYATATGRQKVENIVIGQATDHVKREFRGLTELLKYWRDEAAHGSVSNISDNEAYTSLAMLLRYAMFIAKSWEELIA